MDEKHFENKRAFFERLASTSGETIDKKTVNNVKTTIPDRRKPQPNVRLSKRDSRRNDSCATGLSEPLKESTPVKDQNETNFVEYLGRTLQQQTLGEIPKLHECSVPETTTSPEIHTNTEDLVIGIDLGTTNSCIALYKDNIVKILGNDDDDKITPSAIFFQHPDHVIIGKHAKTMSKLNPDLGFYELKRLIGRKYNEFYMQNFPFRIEPDTSNDPVIVIPHKENILKKTPQELYTILLQKLKEIAEKRLGHQISKAVITVPAYFNVFQREITLTAARDAGLTVLKLLNEPTAAALSYLFEHDSKETSYSLVYDLGGGTFDVAILKRNAENIEIVGVSGDTQLGGHDLDRLIFDYVSEQLEKKYDYNPKTDKVNVRRLNVICEDVKKELSQQDNSEIKLYSFVKNIDFVTINLTRKQFEKMAKSLFKKTIEIVDICVKNSGIPKSSFKEIILCGGSTRIPKIQKLLKKYFKGKILNKFLNPEECVAEGAALQAAMLSKHPNQEINKFHLKDVVPLSLGISVLGDEMDVIIERNTPIPASASVNYMTVMDQQTTMSFQMYEGERANVKKNRFLGELRIKGITSAPPRQCEVTLTVEVDQNGIVKLTAREIFQNITKELIVGCTRGDQSESEIKYALWDAERNKEEDLRFKEFVKLKRYLINYCTAVRHNLEKKDLVDQYRNVYDECGKSLLNGRDATIEEENRVMFYIREVRDLCITLVEKYDFELIPDLE